jgi:hypothetical protein
MSDTDDEYDEFMLHDEEQDACHQEILDRIQRYADQGRLRVERFRTGHTAIFFDEHGDATGMSGGYLCPTPYQDELALVQWSEEPYPGMIRIALLMQNLPNAPDFQEFDWPFTQQIERSGMPTSFIITMPRHCLYDY